MPLLMVRNSDKYVSLENLSLKFRGSSNQRIIMVKESLKEGKVILSALNEYKEFKPIL